MYQLETYVADISKFWTELVSHWPQMYALIQTMPNQRTAVLELINGLLTDQLFSQLQIEMTYGSLNKIDYEQAAQLVELYISPRLSKDNVPLMNDFYKMRKPLYNVNIVKYKAYHPRDNLIQQIDADAIEILYDDFGCQTNVAYNEEKQPVLNLVILVKQPTASKILTKKKIGFIDYKETTPKDIELDKWLPNDSAIIDIMLLNIIGEYNLIHNIGYIEFIPEDDPIIAAGSTFLDLETIRGELEILRKIRPDLAYACHTCNKQSIQADLLICTKCRSTHYCGKLCQKIDYTQHKKRCNVVCDV